jgi:hypothetical protein
MDVGPPALPDFISGKMYKCISHSIHELISSQISLKPFLELNWDFFADKIQIPTNMWKPTPTFAVNSVNYVL